VEEKPPDMREKFKKVSWRVLRFVANWLETACCLFHWIPGYNCKLAMWSADLDEKFNLGVWKKTNPENI
jgi:hypothetical protein